MIKTLSFDGLRECNVARCEELYHDMIEWTPSEIGNDLAGEVGELCNHIKKMHRLHYIKGMTEQQKTDEYLRYLAEARKELADVILYTDLLAAKLGVKLSEVIINKFNETSIKLNSKYFLK